MQWKDLNQEITKMFYKIVLNCESQVNNGSDGFVGSLDEVQFFNLALTSNDLQSIFNAKCYGTCK